MRSHGALPCQLARCLSRAWLMIIPFFITTRPGNGSDGAAEQGWYTVENGVLKMVDKDGNPTGRTHHLDPGENPLAIAMSLRRQAWLATSAASEFNRPLRYGPSGVA
jgi:hypothetical protein